MLFTVSIDRSSQRHRVTGHWHRPSLSLSLSLSLHLSRSTTTAHPFSVPFCRAFSLSLPFSLGDLSLSAYLVLNYPNSISVQLQFIPVSKRQSRGVHFASAPPLEAIISFLHTSPARLFKPITSLSSSSSSSSDRGADRRRDDGRSRFKQIAMYNRFITTSVATNTRASSGVPYLWHLDLIEARSHRTMRRGTAR